LAGLCIVQRGMVNMFPVSLQIPFSKSDIPAKR